jgi:predicted RNA-binding Zn ribbon-like protein
MESTVSPGGGLNVEESLALDFINTNDWHASEKPIERLKDYADLAAWAERVGLATRKDAEQLRRHADSHPVEAQAVLERARNLREALYRLFTAHIEDRPTDPADIGLVNAELPAALAHSRLQPSEGGYVISWPPEPRALDRLLWPIAFSGADLLTNPDLLSRVGQCADDRGCGWLFLDLTKNRSRRWCSMRGCGNRAKAQRHYHRQQDAG